MANSRAKGGRVTRDRYGIAFCRLCHRPLDTSYFVELGAKGGEAVLAKRGREWFSQIGRLGGRGKTKEKRESNNEAEAIAA